MDEHASGTPHGDGPDPSPQQLPFPPQPSTQPRGPAAAPPPHELPRALTAEELASLAGSRPDLWPAIAAHPNAYPDLQQWIADQSEARQAVPAAVEFTADAGRAGAPPRSGTRQRTALIAGGLAAVLALGGGATALALTHTWPFGADGPIGSGGDAQTVAEAITFAEGIERMWSADSNEYVTPVVGELGQDFSYLRAPFTRGSIALEEADYPAATTSAVMFNARGDGSRLIMLDSATGETLLDHDLGGLAANCIADEHDGEDGFLCVSADDQSDRSTLLRVDPHGEMKEFEFDLALHRVAANDERIIVAGDGGAVVALDRSGKEQWRRGDLPNGAYAGIDLGSRQTLLRGYNGWTLLDERGEMLAHADVTGPYDGGNGECDARLTASDHLFVASDDDTLCAKRGLSYDAHWGFGENLSGTEIFSAGGREYVFRQDDDGIRLLRFPESESGELEPVLNLALGGELLGATDGDEPILVVLVQGDAVSFSVDNGEQVAKWKVTSASSDARDPVRGIVLDEAGTVLVGDTAYDAYSGEALWELTAGGLDLSDGRMTEAGLIVLGGGCPECSIAGGSYTSSTLTLYAPSGSGGEPIGGGGGDAQPASTLPDTIPYDCPADTILLAWAELPDGWVLVCGITPDVPTLVAYQPAAKADIVFSAGAKQPTGADAKAAVNWDAQNRRYTAELQNGDTATLDYEMGTLTVREGDTAKVVAQQRTVRYLFVVLGDRVRTVQDAEGSDGAFSVKTPKDTAEDQVRYMIEVLERAYEGRALVKDALPKLQNCTAGAGGYADTVQAMKSVRDNRAELLEALDAMPVDKIPEGQALLDDLTEAIRHSHAANVEYVAWAEAAHAKGCASLSASGEAEAAASDAPKQRFADRWNLAVAPKYGVRTFDAWYI